MSGAKIKMVGKIERLLLHGTKKYGYLKQLLFLLEERKS